MRITLLVILLFLSEERRTFVGYGPILRNGMIVAVLQEPTVAEELMLPGDSAKRLKDLYDDMIRAEPNCSEGEDCASQRETYARAQGEMDGRARDILTRDQLRRLKQIVWQRAGIVRVGDDNELAEAVGLTAEQRAHLVTIQRELEQAATELAARSRTDAPFDPQPLDRLRKRAEQDATSVLRKEQLARYRRELGKPFSERAPTVARPSADK